MEPVIAAGGLAAASPEEVAANSDIIFICVSDTPDVEAVVLGDHGVIHGAKSGSLVVDHSTISPSVKVNVEENSHGDRAIVFYASMYHAILGFVSCFVGRFH